MDWNSLSARGELHRQYGKASEEKKGSKSGVLCSFSFSLFTCLEIKKLETRPLLRSGKVQAREGANNELFNHSCTFSSVLQEKNYGADWRLRFLARVPCTGVLWEDSWKFRQPILISWPVLVGVDATKVGELMTSTSFPPLMLDPFISLP